MGEVVVCESCLQPSEDCEQLGHEVRRGPTEREGGMMLGPSKPLLFTCPDCGSIGRIDDEQGSGQVSIICSECRWHGYVDNAKADMFGRRVEESE